MIGNNVALSAVHVCVCDGDGSGCGADAGDCQVKSSQVAFNMIVASALSYKQNTKYCAM